MSEELTQKKASPNVRLAIGLIVAFALGLAVGILVPRLWPSSDDGVVIQKGVIHDANGNGEFKVFYPRPFASPPNLKIIPGGRGEIPHHVEITEQRADGFRITINGWVTGGEQPGYEARGLPAKAHE